MIFYGFSTGTETSLTTKCVTEMKSLPVIPYLPAIRHASTTMNDTVRVSSWSNGGDPNNSQVSTLDDHCFTVAGPSYLSTYVILNWLSCSSSVAQDTSVWWRPQRLVTVTFWWRWNVVTVLLSGGMNHSTCCTSDTVPGHCLSLCTGEVISSPLHVSCLPHFDHILNCLHQTLGISITFI